jgi:hypothetical protein
MVTMKKVEASTILETLIASVLILIIFSVVVAVFLQTDPTKGLQIIKAEQVLRQYVDETNTEQKFEDGEKVYENYVLKRQVIESTGKRIVINFFAYNSNNELQASQQRVLLLP